MFTYERKRKNISSGGPFWGMSLLYSSWGNFNLPTVVKNEEELINKFGERVDVPVYGNKENWMNVWSFLEYTDSLKIFRIGERSVTPTFDGSNDISSVAGTVNSHTFLNSISSSSYRPSYWNSADNGSDLYYCWNDISPEHNIPNYKSDQLLFIAGKYPGVAGNYIRLSVANSNSDLNSVYVFRHDSLALADASSFSVGDMITGDTSGESKEILQIIKNSVFVENGENFQDGEDVNGATTNILELNPADSYTENPSFSYLFDRMPDKDEICLTVSAYNTQKETFELYESGIYSLSRDSENYIGDMNSRLIRCRVSDNYIHPNDAVTEDDYIVDEICSSTLRYGASDPMTGATSLTQYRKLLSYDQFDVIFAGSVTTEVYNFMKDMIGNDKILIVGDVT